ncbi:tyrosine-protein kinase [Pontixanthobacter gangjinensis]|uniref:non-specific protein-tyrosine kinase n=1 Tax=Christiangramia aestuarii TaxID=1028746 RepID=A0A7K1LNF8_9FLAO|nr:polysaccharide biosynthesis tyrosine autokinase [Christiangramia aestuarii]MUP42181.1 polysaccharide biosynthesis tyrosine autokinase [Christiangramia aestuarii]
MAQDQRNIQARASEINIREELEKYLRYWPWFVLSALLALLIAFFYLQHTSRVYSASASVIIKDGKNSQNSEMAAFQDLGLFNGMNSNSIENEIGLMKSRGLMRNVVNALDLNITYHDADALRNSELYEVSPVEIKVLSRKNKDDAIYYEYKISRSGDGIIISNLSNGNEVSAKLGKPVDLDFGVVSIQENENISWAGYPGEIIFKVHPVLNLAKHYSNSLAVSLKEKNSSLIELSLNDPVRKKAEDILDQLILEYNRETIEDKNLVATNTANFIDERLKIINGELDSVESGKVEFKEQNRLTDIQSESQMYVESAKEYRIKQERLATQLELVNAVLSYISDESSSDLLPANLGIEEANVNEAISQYNDIVLERNRILAGSSELNPVVKKLNAEISQLESNIVRSLNQLKKNLNITKSNLDQQVASVGSRISSVPSQEKQFRGIERQQQIKESLYLFLLQKREENSLSLAVTAPKAKIVDTALSSNIPVSPNIRSIYLTALLLGLGVPFAFFYIRNLLNNKVESRTDLEDIISNVSIVGEIPRIGKGMAELIEKNDRSVLAESFRILHTNLQYLLVNSGNKKKGVKIFITSTIKGEGKTFIAFNTATTLANSGKKVLIMGADLRNPQLQRFEAGAKHWQGVSDYLANEELELNRLIKKSSLHENLDLLSSGSIPPNPSELLRHSKTKNLFENLEEAYDYIIVDTAPSMLVSDTFLINDYADLTLYVVRAGFTERKLLDFPENSRKEGKLQNLSFILNDVKAANFGYGNKYGYAYGYAYGDENDNFWRKLKNRAAFW